MHWIGNRWKASPSIEMASVKVWKIKSEPKWRRKKISDWDEAKEDEEKHTHTHPNRIKKKKCFHEIWRDRRLSWNYFGKIRWKNAERFLCASTTARKWTETESFTENRFVVCVIGDWNDEIRSVLLLLLLLLSFFMVTSELFFVVVVLLCVSCQPIPFNYR